MLSRFKIEIVKSYTPKHMAMHDIFVIRLGREHLDAIIQRKTRNDLDGNINNVKILIS